MKIKITVTKNDIAKGMRFKPCGCPIALACERKGYYVSVTPAYIRFCASESRLTDIVQVNNLPAKVEKFIQDFDHAQEVKPFTFELNVNKDVKPFKVKKK